MQHDWTRNGAGKAAANGVSVALDQRGAPAVVAVHLWREKVLRFVCNTLIPLRP